MTNEEINSALNVDNSEEMLRHFPTKYEDLKVLDTPIKPIDGQRFVAVGRPFNVKSIDRGELNIINFQLENSDGIISSFSIINQPYYFNFLICKKDILVVAYYSEARKVYGVKSILFRSSSFVTYGIRPIYNLPRKISLSQFENRIDHLLTFDKKDDYFLHQVPQKYREKYKLISDYDAYINVHHPKNFDDIKKGLRVFKYEEALEYSIKSSLIREDINTKKKDSKKIISISDIDSFIHSLTINLTHCQSQSIEEILNDMNSNKIMFRLLQGDVGTGKTIIAQLALYANFLRGEQGVLMAPTYELALQHYNSCVKLFKNLNIKVELLSSTLSDKKRGELLKRLKDGGVDILISTHASFQESVVYKNLGLVIIDEQHRFGANQRQLMADKGEGADILLMSATPIPRTFAQILNCDIDVSTLDTFPNGERNVQTKLTVSQDPLIYQAIEKAIKNHRQVYIIVPKIEDSFTSAKSINEVYQDISDRFGKSKVSYLHGKLNKESQNEIIKNFSSNKVPILVSTTVVEVGIDVLNAGLLIIYSANYFGLSQLHQLRGRIGRNGKFALTLLIYDGKDQDAKTKLEFLCSHKKGEEIALYDMQSRGVGSYSGSNQSGDSDLKICNFVLDQKIFDQAKIDAKEILTNSENSDNKEYLNRILKENKVLIS